MTSTRSTRSHLRRRAKPLHPVTRVPAPSGAEAEASVYHIYMAALAMLAILVSVALYVSPDEPDVVGVLSVVDIVLCGFFLYDFFRHLARAPSKWRYLRGWGLVDLVSSIPFVAEARWLRVARVLRFLMIIRALRILLESARIERRSIVMAGATLSIQVLFIVICIVVLNVEHDAPNGNIKTAGDVLWWAIATVTTVGYGDRYPVTETGRIAGATLMLCGIGYLATALGVMAQAFVPKRKHRD